MVTGPVRRPPQGTVGPDLGAVSRATNRPRAFPRFFHFPRLLIFHVFPLSTRSPPMSTRRQPNDARHQAAPGSIATRASRRDIGQSLSNVMFVGTVLRRARGAGRRGDPVYLRCARPDRQHRGHAGHDRGLPGPPRASPAASSFQPRSFTRATRCQCYRVSRSEWVITGREPQNKGKRRQASLALETDRAALSMDPEGYLLAGSVARGASGVGSDSAILSMASGILFHRWRRRGADAAVRAWPRD